MIGGFNGTARVEGQFFTQLRPLLQIEAPVGYHAAFDRRTFASILLLEDLVATKSATFCNHRTYVTREMADDMIDVLAALHARFYGEPRACDAISLGRRLSEMVHDRRGKDEAWSITPERHSKLLRTSFPER